MLPPDTQRRLIDLLKQLGVAALYALLIHLDHRYFESGTTVSAFEAASGFALAVLLLGGKRYAWGVFLGAILINVMTAQFLVAVVISSGHTLEALCGAWLLTHDNKFDPTLQSLRDYLRLILLGGGVGIGIAANIGVTVLLASGLIPSGTYSLELLHWWTGDTLGVILVTPLILVCWQTKNDWLGAKRVAEAALLLGLTFLAGQIVFLGWFHDSLGNIARGYVTFLFITWIAVRLGTRGTVITLTVTAIQALMGAYHGVGFFANDIAQTHLVNYWLYTVILSVTGMALATFLAERKQAEAEKEIAASQIKRAQAMLQTVLDSTPDWIFAKDTSYHFLFVNRAFAASQGCTPQDMAGRSDTEFWPDDLCNGDPARGIRGFHTDDDVAMAGNTIHNPYDPATHVDGKLHIFDTLKLPLLDADGHCYGVLGYARDITERKAIEKELLESKNKLQATLDAVPDLLFEVGLDGRIYNYHSPRTDLLAAPADVFLGKKFSDVLPPSVAEVCMSALRDAHKSGVSTGKHYELPLPQGKFWFELSVSRKHVNPGQEPRFIFLARDITERKTAEQQLRSLSAHMLNVREEEKASIAREIHDDMGGTLTALKMDAYWLSRKLPANEETAPLLERIRSMSQLIDDAVGVTRRVISDLRPTMLDDLGLLAALEWQCTQFHKRTGIECRVNCVEDEGDLDKQRSIALLRIFQEALTNVARHSGASRVEVEFRHDEEEAFLSINDNGCGLPKESSVAANSYGILGMTERTEQLGGKIKFDSQPGSGLRITVAFPLPADNKRGEA